MASAIPDLWPDDIRVDVVTPVAILRAQEGSLEKKTKGILHTKLSTTTGEDWVQHQLDLVAPLLQKYRVTLLTARHDLKIVYPVIVTARGFRLDSKSGFPTPPPPLAMPNAALEADQREAKTENEFIDLVKSVLQSRSVRGLIESLIAQSNETRPAEQAS